MPAMERITCSVDQLHLSLLRLVGKVVGQILRRALEALREHHVDLLARDDLHIDEISFA